MTSIAAITLAAYVAMVNLALQLPLTQSLVNALRPEKFHVAWENAWTLIPFRFHATNVSANGQSRSQQWQVHASSASASINPLPLIFKRVWLSDVRAENVDYRQRPRLKPDRDYGALMPFFPDIEGREVLPVDSASQEKKRPWRIAVDGAEASGRHSFWLMQFRGSGNGVLGGDFTFETRGGPFALEDGYADLALNSLYINGDNEAFHRGSVQGTVALQPFIPRQSKGLELLKYLTSDAVVDFEVNSLAFIGVLMRNFKQMAFDGKGRVQGRINIASGKLLTDTDITVRAGDLQVDVMDHRIFGQGEVVMGSSADVPGWLDLEVDFSEPTVTRAGDQHPLLVGETLKLGLTDSGDLTGEADPADNRRSMSFRIDNLLAPDLALFEHYLPAKWPLSFFGGQGRVNGIARIAPSAVEIDLSMTSEGADLGAREYRFTSNLDAALRLSNPATGTSNTLVGGSYIKLSDSRLTNEDDLSVTPWEASLVVNEGSLGLVPGDQKEADDNIRDLLEVINAHDSKALLSSLEGFLQFESNVSSLAWIDVLLDRSHGAAVRGSGVVSGAVYLEEGMPAPGTDIEVLSDELSLDILDYRIEGNGIIELAVKSGKDSPDWLIGINLTDGDMRRLDEDMAHIEDVDLSLQALIENVSLEQENKDRTLAFNLKTARMKNLSVFNNYLPPESPIAFVAGTANLESELVLQPMNADGSLRLDSKDLEMELDGQTLLADLLLDVEVVDGVPRNMNFDLSGSSLTLSNVRVAGSETNFDDQNWFADIRLNRADTTWRKPLRLDAQADLRIADSRPVVALFGNRSSSPDWLLEMITIEDVEGEASLEMADNRIVIPFAHAVSDKIEVGARASIDAQSRNGVIYARYKKLDALLEIKDGTRNIDVIRARQKYERYTPETVGQNGL